MTSSPSALPSAKESLQAVHDRYREIPGGWGVTSPSLAAWHSQKHPGSGTRTVVRGLSRARPGGEGPCLLPSPSRCLAQPTSLGLWHMHTLCVTRAE